MTALVDPAEFGGRTLVYLPKYATADDPAWSKTDEEIRGEFLAALARLYPHFAATTCWRFASRACGTSLRCRRSATAARAADRDVGARPVPRQFRPDRERHAERQRDRAAGGVVARDAVPAAADHGTPAWTFPTFRTQLLTTNHAKSIASLSLDLDNKWSYLKTHGDRGWESFPSYLDVVVPRFLEVLDDAGPEDHRVRRRPGCGTGAKPGRRWLRSPRPGTRSATTRSITSRGCTSIRDAELEDEITVAEEAICAATGRRPTGFRGRLQPLASGARAAWRGAAISTTPRRSPRSSARWPGRITSSRRGSADEQREERQRLFGNWTRGLPADSALLVAVRRRMRPSPAPQRLLEIPVTTMPLFRVPIHFSYLLFLRQFSRAAAWAYWQMAMRAVPAGRRRAVAALASARFSRRRRRAGPGVFPGDAMRGAEKVTFVRSVLTDFAKRFDVAPLGRHADYLASQNNLAVVRVPQSEGSATDGQSARSCIRNTSSPPLPVLRSPG